MHNHSERRVYFYETRTHLACGVPPRHGNPLGDEGLAALVAPRLLAGAPPPPAGGLAKLKRLHLNFTRITDAGCATLVAALDSGALPALELLSLQGTPAGAAAKAAVLGALAKRGSHRRGQSRGWPRLPGQEESQTWIEVVCVSSEFQRRFAAPTRDRARRARARAPRPDGALCRRKLSGDELAGHGNISGVII